MSTRRDRAAKAVADAIWGDEFAGAWLADEHTEAYRIADHVLAEVDRIPDVSEMDNLDAPLAGIEVRRTPDEWCRIKGIEILDADGWRGKNGRPWADLISETEFLRRALVSTQRFKIAWTGGGVVGGTASPPQDEEQAREAASPLTDGGAAMPPADPQAQPVSAGGDRVVESATAAPSAERVPSSVLPRPFLLVRKRDITGLSGTGIVATGCEWPDKTATLRWATRHPSVAHFDSVDAVLAVHGHDGATVARWLEVKF